MAIAKASDKRKEHSTQKVLLSRNLSDAEMELIRKAKVETSAPYELDDLDEEGKLISRKPDQAS